MKTGNAIVAIFFWYMSFQIPLAFFNIVKENAELVKVFPIDVKILIVILSITLIVLGCIVFVFGAESKFKGREWRKKENLEDKTEQTEEDKIEEQLGELDNIRLEP